MRPLELTIEGLRSFREPVTLDLRGRDRIAIVGDTGAGKSSIIEAITYALYGQPTFTGLNRELMNDAATSLRVVLRFRAAGEEWEVVRALRRRRTGTVGPQTAQLRRFDLNGDLLELVEQARKVNERIESAVGLNHDAFLRTTILPQGRFAQLLVEDDPRVRSMILRQVWRTDELEAAGQVAAAAGREIADLRARIEQAASRYPQDPTAHLAWLREQAEQARRAADAAAAIEREAADAHAALRSAEAERVRVGAASERLATFDAPGTAAELAPVAAAADEIDGLESALRNRRDRAAGELAAIPSDDDGPSVAQVVAALTTLDGIPRLAADGAAAAAELRERSTAAEDSRAAAERAAARERRVAAAAADHEELRQPLEQALQTAEQRRDRLAALHGAALEGSDAVDAVREELARREQGRQEVECRLQEAADDAARRAQAAVRAQEHLAVTRRSESAAMIAGGLHPGDECPICRRTLAPAWEAPAGGGLRAVEREAEAAGTAAAEARDVQVALATSRDAAVEAVKETGERLRVASEVAAKARRVLAAAAAQAGESSPAVAIRAAAGDPTDPLPVAESLLAPLQAAVTAAERAAAAHAERRGELAEEAAEQARVAGIAAEAAASAERLRAAADRTAAAALVRLRDAVAAVPEPYRPPLYLPAAAGEFREADMGLVRDGAAAARQRERVVAERAQRRDRLAAKMRELAAEQEALEHRRSAEVVEPLAAVARGLNEHRDLLARSALELNLEPDLPEVLTAERPAEVAARIDHLGGATAYLLQVAGIRETRAAAAQDGARARLQAIGRAAKLGVDDLDAVVAGARAAAESARYTARMAQESAGAFASVVDHVAELRQLLADVEERERALSDLEAALKAGAFLKWLTLRRSRSLLVHASRMLEQISDGRYAFVEPADEFDRWQVLDRESGQPRSPASLSGGEQFIASLALALGMVEMMARSGGSLDSLFLDEGFGTLDRNNLDAVIEALGSAAAGGRLVVLISHVQAVAEQVADVAAVTRTHAGSRIEWLSDAERRRTAESEAGAGALGGLLE